MKRRHNGWILMGVVCLTAGQTATAATSYTLKSKIYGGTFDGFADRLTIAAADVDGDGDTDVIGGYAQGGLVYLRNQEQKLPVNPPSITVVSGEAVNFSVEASQGAVSWRFVTNNSSGTLDTVSGVYTSGPNPSVIDVVEAEDTEGTIGRSYVNIISPDDVSAAGKAIIVGGGRSLGDPVFHATEYLTDQAFNTLLYRGFGRTNVQYHSFGNNHDVDGNGILDDIDGDTAFGSVENTFSNWVGNANKLFVYLCDHGSDSNGEGSFRLNAGEFLSAAQLNDWLNTIQDTYNTEVVVALDFCYAGSFVDELAYTGTAKRVVLAATQPTELTYFIAGGLVSFSDVFFNALLQGFDLATAFGLAEDAMFGYQSAMLDDDQDGMDSGDGDIAATINIGASFIVGRDFPTIGEVMDNATLAGETSTLVWAGRITSVYPINRVWCSVISPNYQVDTNSGIPVVDVPEATLTYNSAHRRYEGILDGFTENEPYKLSFHAEDIWGGVSLPKQAQITQTGFNEKAVLAACGVTFATDWPAIQNMANAAYATLRTRQFTDDTITYLCPDLNQDTDKDGTNDVDAIPTLSSLGSAITNWSGDANRLTVYLIGHADGGSLRLNATQTLSAVTLDSWIDTFQASNSIANIILEFPGSGSFLPSLAPPDGAKRIAVACTAAGKTCLWRVDGMLSFSRMFLSHVFEGRTIGDSFNRASEAIRRASGRRLRQTPQLDDSGDGNANTAADGPLADTRYIGPAFLTGDDTPHIGQVMDDALIFGTNELALWAADVADVDGISNVWCVITPPDYDGTEEPPQTNLAYAAISNRYETSFNFDQLNEYMLTFYARDNNGELSPPVQATIMVADTFEADNTTSNASLHAGGIQQRNFHTTQDVDWVSFSVVSSRYDVVTTNLDPEAALSLALWHRATNGSLTWMDNVPSGTNGVAHAWVDGRFDPTGTYYVAIGQPSSGPWFPAAYNLSLTAPADADGDGLDDGWEELYFGSTSCVATVDSDGDGLTNEEELWAGTHPRDPNSVLSVTQAVADASNGITLRWPVTRHHWYRVRSTPSLTNTPWPNTYGPWQAAPGQGKMEWTDPTTPIPTNRFYRVDSPTP